MVRRTNCFNYINKNKDFILFRLEKLANYNNSLLEELNNNAIIRELIFSNKLSPRWFSLLQYVLQIFLKMLLYIINFLKKF